MSDPTVPGIGDLFGLMGGSNPLASIGKTIEQFRRGVDGFFDSVETFNTTMRELNRVAQRLNRLLDDVEEPIRAVTPQLARTVRAAEAMVEQLSGPVERVAPALARLADVLSTPGVSRLPNDLHEFLTSLRELSSRLQPLTQLAESAGSMFGLRALGSLRPGAGQPDQSLRPSAAEHEGEQSSATRRAAQRPPAKRAQAAAPATTTEARKAPAKKSTAKARSASPRAAG